MFLSLQPRLCTAVSRWPVSLHESEELSGQGHLAGQGLAGGPDTPPQSDTPSQLCSRNPLRGRWLLQAPVPDEGREGEGTGGGGGGCVGWPWRLPGPWQLGCHVGWAGGAPSPRERLASVGADCVYTFPTHLAHAPSYSPGLSHPWALCTTCTFAAPLLLQEVATLSRCWAPSAPVSAHCRRGGPSVSKRLPPPILPHPSPISLERAAAWEWEQESPGAWQTEGIKGNQRGSAETESWGSPGPGGEGAGCWLS